jgi:hypothetical protein
LNLVIDNRKPRKELKKYALLQEIEESEEKWTFISMYFVTGLPQCSTAQGS